MLKMSKLILDIDMHLCIEKGMRRGISYITEKISTWNLTIINNQVNTLHILMQIIYMVGLRVSIRQIVELNG